MSFKDLSVEQIAALTKEEIEEYIRVEMMENGVKAVEKPAPFLLLPPKVKTHKLYKVYGLYFETPGQVDKLFQLRPKKTEYSWDLGTNLKFLSDVEKEYEQVEIFDKEDFIAKGDEMVAWRKQKDVWDNLNGAHEVYLQRRNKIASEFWTKWDEAKKKVEGKHTIQKAFEEYKTLAKGDEGIALGFLFKTFGEEEAREAIGLQKIEQVESAEVAEA